MSYPNATFFSYLFKPNLTFLKISIHSFHNGFCIFWKSLLVSSGNNLLIVVFKVLHASRVIAVDSLFKKSPQKEVRWCKGWGLRWPTSTSDNAVSEKIQQKSCCYFHSICFPTNCFPTYCFPTYC